MSLLQKIILVNRYTIKNPTTGKGSRGSTPGRFITSYMARDPATETLLRYVRGKWILLSCATWHELLLWKA